MYIIREKEVEMKDFHLIGVVAVLKGYCTPGGYLMANGKRLSQRQFAEDCEMSMCNAGKIFEKLLGLGVLEKVYRDKKMWWRLSENDFERKKNR